MGHRGGNWSEGARRSGLQRQRLGPTETLALTPSSLSLRFSISCLRIILSLSLPHMESMKKNEIISVKMFGEEKCLIIVRGNYDCSFKMISQRGRQLRFL